VLTTATSEWGAAVVVVESSLTISEVVAAEVDDTIVLGIVTSAKLVAVLNTAVDSVVVVSGISFANRLHEAPLRHCAVESFLPTASPFTVMGSAVFIDPVQSSHRNGAYVAFSSVEKRMLPTQSFVVGLVTLTPTSISAKH